jgi:CubicO group peptidase (beta-lactamase class C family)
MRALVTGHQGYRVLHGEQDIEVRHILSHSSGVSGWDTPLVTEDMYDWDKATARLGGQAPWWEPGTAAGYHAQNQGHLIGSLVRRVTGNSLKEFVRNERAGPLDADFQIGARPGDGCAADIISPPPMGCPSICSGRTTRCARDYGEALHSRKVRL